MMRINTLKLIYPWKEYEKYQKERKITFISFYVLSLQFISNYNYCNYKVIKLIKLNYWNVEIFNDRYKYRLDYFNKICITLIYLSN